MVRFSQKEKDEMIEHLIGKLQISKTNHTYPAEEKMHARMLCLVMESKTHGGKE